jgi:hypothetical protein
MGPRTRGCRSPASVGLEWWAVYSHIRDISSYRPHRRGVCASALAAADFADVLARGLRSVADAFVAAAGEVTLLGARV